jgi:D-beta-D-heptose 7-phosphate kinase/D-beta-D-heptose 1-phosphate adenosyltransferase
VFTDFTKIVDIVERGFAGAGVLVVGDLMLDRYVWGEVERISPEAPVPVVRVKSISECAGGAGNVAINLSRLGCTVRLAGVVGEDQEQDSLLALLQECDVATQAVIASKDRQTTVKTRIMGGHQQMLRMDMEESSSVSDSCAGRLLDALSAEFDQHVSVVVLSDYGKGMLSPLVCRELIGRARQQNIAVLVDPKGLDYGKYAGATGISPNRGELARATGIAVEDLDRLLQAGEKLRSALGLEFIALTLSELGIALLESAGVSQFPAFAREVFDVSGAGDTVIATLAASVAAGVPLHDAISLANLAAGIVVRKLGTVPVTREELLAALMAEGEQGTGKIFCSSSELLNRVARWRIAGERIVFTNGCFDILHAGHVSLLQRARREGDRLIVGLNTDRSVAALKGPTRPLIGEQERAHVLAALAAVDAVMLFDDDTPLKLIRTIRPEVLVKGGDYLENQVVGAAEVRSWNGRVAILPLLPGLSTSELIRRAAARA